MGIEEVEGGVIEGILWPGLLPQPPHGGLVAVQAHPELRDPDQGLTPLEHVTNYAVFASGGLEVHSYAIEEIRGLASGAVVYNHDRDTPPRKQIFSRKSIEMLNTMMQQVVQAGTARAVTPLERVLLHQALAARLGEPVEDRVSALSSPVGDGPRTQQGHLLPKSLAWLSGAPHSQSGG